MINFMKIAKIISDSSKCVSLKVGAVIVKDDRIISTGYNGTPTGQKNCCEYAVEQNWVEPKYNPSFPHNNFLVLNPEFRNKHSEWSKKHEIHAELNAILFAAKNGTPIEGASMYVTFSPCPDCAKAITQSGIKHLFYANKYDRNEDDWELILKKSNISVTHLPI